MELYRIVQEQYAADLSGNGAKLYGGRWNSEGLSALYTSSSRALALLETLAHTPAKLLRQKKYLLLTLEVPDSAAVRSTSPAKLRAGWDAPEIPAFTRAAGDDFLRDNRQLLFRVPSIMVFEENNFVLNPEHPDMKKVRIIHRRRILFEDRMVENK